MTAGLVADIPHGTITTGGGEPAVFSAADGRALPFAAETFDKVYCTGVIHVVPDRTDAVRIVDELVRVCRPGGTVLVGAVPDEAKRGAEFALLWRRADLRGKLRLAVAKLVPATVRRHLRRSLRRPEQEVAFLKFDLA
jgi:ubiquinone/menaquinone biosynthesis C-methylase UbiE